MLMKTVAPLAIGAVFPPGAKIEHAMKGNMNNTSSLTAFKRAPSLGLSREDELFYGLEGEVRLRVQAMGLNRSESMFMHGYWLEPTKLPAKLGYEASGVRAREGDGEVYSRPVEALDYDFNLSKLERVMSGAGKVAAL